MSILSKLPHIIEEGKRQWEELSQNSASAFSLIEDCNLFTEEKGTKGIIANGDNLHFMAYLLEKGEKLDLIYVDPPFYSKADYKNAVKLKDESIENTTVIKQNAYTDTWDTGIEGYLKMIVPRLYFMKALLKDTGTLWVHLDWHVAHYVKIFMDEIFGEENFINEVIWQYKSGGSSKKRFGRKHDTLLFYGKSKNYYFKPQQEKSYNRGLKPYRFKGVEEFQDEVGWYTMVNMKDIWQLDMVGRTATERTGYATQKPESLIGRILESCTKEGDLCADFFSGSGTLAAVAQKMHRKWIACDIGGLSTLNTLKRTFKNQNNYSLVEENPKTMGELEAEVQAKERGKIELKLKSYQVKNYQSLPIDEKGIERIQEAVKKDSLQLIEYWSVDFQYDGAHFNPQIGFVKEKDFIELSCEQDKILLKKVAIRGMDTFGNRFFKVIPINE